MDSRDGQRDEAEPQMHVAPLSLRESEKQLPSAGARALGCDPEHKAGDDDEAQAAMSAMPMIARSRARVRGILNLNPP